jgi:hypothetical protein
MCGRMSHMPQKLLLKELLPLAGLAWCLRG